MCSPFDLFYITLLKHIVFNYTTFLVVFQECRNGCNFYARSIKQIIMPRKIDGKLQRQTTEGKYLITFCSQDALSNVC